MYQKKMGDLQNKNDTDREERVACSRESGKNPWGMALILFLRK